MRYEFFNPAVNRDSLHPDSVYHEELRLAQQFVENCEQDTTLQSCPISNHARSEVFFEKWGATYAFCPETWSLSLGNMPSPEILQHYFFESPLAKLRASDEYQELLSRSRQPLWEHLAEWIEGRMQRYLREDKVDLIDWGAKAKGWSQLLQQASWVRRYMTINPLAPLKDSHDNQNADVICLLDVIQRSATPRQLLKDVTSRLRPGGLLVASCRSGAGFDVLTLAGASDSIFPYDHICLPSPAGIRLLIEQAGLELLELTTPGMLDVELIQAAADNLPHNQFFQRYLLQHQSPQLMERLQAFLQQNNLSSHLRIVARKPQEPA